MKRRAKVAVFGEAVSGQVHDLFVGRGRLESWSIRSSFGDFGSTHSVRVLWKLNRTSYNRRQPSESGAEVCIYRHLLISLHLINHSAEVEVNRSAIPFKGLWFRYSACQFVKGKVVGVMCMWIGAIWENESIGLD